MTESAARGVGIDLAPAAQESVGAPDRRARIPEPPPVRLLTVDDAHLTAPAGIETRLDAFYVNLLGFEREPACEFPVYRSENFRLIFDVREPPIERDGLRPLGIQTPSLGAIEQKLLDAQIPYVRQRGLLAGQHRLVLLDPAGNWIEIAARDPIG